MSSGMHIPFHPALQMQPTQLLRPETTSEPSASAEALWKIAVSTRRMVGLTTMTVPLSLFVQLLIEGHVLRHDAFASIGVSGYIEGVAHVGRAFMDALSSVSLVSGGWDFRLVILIGLTLILRYHLMKPLRTLERWAKYRIKAQRVPVMLKRRISKRQRY